MKDHVDLEAMLSAGQNPLIGYIKMKFDQADRARRTKENKWMDNLKAVRGQDSKSSLRPESEVASIYVRTTTTKTKAAYAQINEALLSGEKFPIAVLPTPIPEGIAEFVHLKEPDDQAQAPEGQDLNVGFEGDGVELPPGATQSSVSALIGSAYSEGLKEEMFEEGNDAMGTGIQLSPAKQAARKMEKMIHDQLDEAKARMGLRRALYELCMLGTGAMKGPFSETKTVHNWVDGQLQAETKKFPAVSFVSLWDLYVDPNAYNTNDIEWIIERHRMNLSQLQALPDQSPLFDRAAIEALILEGHNYTLQPHEHELRDNIAHETEHELFEVLEFWGYMDTKMAINDYGLNVPEGSGPTVQVNAWISGGQVLRLTVNPFQPARIPYFLFPYEEDPYSIYGTGIPELMEDLQYLMNGMTRLAVENAMLSGNIILDVDKQALAAEDDMKVYPGKIFERQAGATGNAVNAIEIPHVANQNMQMFAQFRQMADEATGIQSILHGQTGVSGTGRTASGLSMLMDSASMSIKNVIRNIDDHLLKPLAMSYFQWNMQFMSDEHKEIKGDLEIRALGSFNLISKERKAQSLQTFLQLSTNPQLAPLIRLPTIVKELAIQMDMDPEEILNSPEEAMVYAQLMAMNQQAGGGQQAGSLPADQAPAPGEDGFTGNIAGAGNQAGINGTEPTV